ncbi:MAG: VWA domain-containing protein [Prevotella sp.]|nr:VWA domain-containing protein [Prevotella sp.]
MQLYAPTYLYLLAIIPFMVLLMAWAEWKRRKKISRLGERQLVKALIPDASAKRRWLKFLLTQLALAIVIIMLARPQMGTKVSHEKREGIEAIICLDISNSMLAEDVVPSRLGKSKLLIENLVDHFTKDKIGMIVFAGDAFVQLPITSDYVSAKMFLQNIEPSLIQTQGTNIAEAINLAANSFTQQKNIGKTIIVITDGEDHEGGVMEAAKEAADNGFKVFILGIGNSSGAPIPVHGGGYLTDNTGNTVMTALNEQMCQEIAAAGRGTYIHVDNTSTAQERLNDELSKMQKGSIESVYYSEYSEQFQWFGILAIIVLIIEVLVSEAQNPYLRKIRIFKKRSVGIGLLIIAFNFQPSTFNSIHAQDRHYIRQGNRVFHQNNQESPSKAEVKYRKSLSANKNNTQAMYNLGCALMAQNKDSMAMEMFQQSAKAETSKQRKAMSYHNMGVIMQRQQQYGPAIEMYKQALRLTPHDNETRYNLVLCQRQQKNNQNNQGGGGQNNQNNDKNKDKNKDKDKNKNRDKNKNDNKNQDQQQQKQEQQMSKENAEQLLQAAIQEEKATQQRLNKAMSQPKRRNVQKNW